jgi:hypothetical protein
VLTTVSISSPQVVAGLRAVFPGPTETTASWFRLANNQSDASVYPYGDGEGAMIPFTRARPGAVESPELS